MNKVLKVEGMSCGHCEMAVRKALMELDGVESVEVDLATGMVKVQGEDLQDGLVKEAVDEAGYQVVGIE